MPNTRRQRQALCCVFVVLAFAGLVGLTYTFATLKSGDDLGLVLLGTACGLFAGIGSIFRPLNPLAVVGVAASMGLPIFGSIIGLPLDRVAEATLAVLYGVMVSASALCIFALVTRPGAPTSRI